MITSAFTSPAPFLKRERPIVAAHSAMGEDTFRALRHVQDAATFDLNCQAALARVASLRSGETEPVAAPATFDLNLRRAIRAPGGNNRLVAVRPDTPNIGVKVPPAAFSHIDTLDEWPLARGHCFGGAGYDDGDPDQGRIRPRLHERASR